MAVDCFSWGTCTVCKAPAVYLATLERELNLSTHSERSPHMSHRVTVSGYEHVPVPEMSKSTRL